MVSVIVPAFNASATINRAIRSVVGQTYSSWEVIVIDDGSKDGTSQIVEAIADSRIYICRLSENHGAAFARNAGIREAHGDMVAFLDADDEWLPEKLEKQVQVLRQNQSVSIVTCDAVFLNAEGSVFKRGHKDKPPHSGFDAWKALFYYNFIPTPTVLTRRDLLLDVGGFNDMLTVGEDLDLWIRLARRGEIAVVPDVLVRVFDRPASLMKQALRDEWRLVLPIIERHLQESCTLLSTNERAAIEGRRLFDFGARAYASGHYRTSIPLFARSARKGYRPIKGLVNIARALCLSLIKK